MIYNRPFEAALVALDGLKLQRVERPDQGWIRRVREASGVAIDRLADRLGVTKSTVSKMEQAERSGSLSLGRLQAVAEQLDCELVYYFVPRDEVSFLTVGERVLAEMNDERRLRHTRPAHMWPNNQAG